MKAAAKTLAERTPVGNFAELEDLGQDIRRQLILNAGADPSRVVNERVARWRSHGLLESPSSAVRARLIVREDYKVRWCVKVQLKRSTPKPAAREGESSHATGFGAC